MSDFLTQLDDEAGSKRSPNGAGRMEQPKGLPPIDVGKLSLAGWLERDIPSPDFLLGELLSTTSRMMWIGPTGLGKTNILMAIAEVIARGDGFLHWSAGPAPRRVLYIDGEMPGRLMRLRLQDVVRRSGERSASLFILSREDFRDMPPLNTEDGRQFIDRVLEALGGIDLVVFDNIQALTTGDANDPFGAVQWQEMLPWIKSLTGRCIGQIWVHHTGLAEDHGYGSKTREWQLDTVVLMERIERPEIDIAFRLSFTKARERTPDNRADFEPCIITLVDDRWSSERGGNVGSGKRQAKDRALELLQDAIVREGTIPAACEHIPPDTACVTEGLWRGYCKAGCISAGETDKAFRSAFSRSAKRLIETGRVGKWELWVWPIR